MNGKTAGQKPVLILGAGINGAALARELLLNGRSVWLVDSADIASGATSGSSRLIHGGLRYLEYGDFDLVKESLAERMRLLQLAPQFVRPLRLWIPSARRLGGIVGAIGRFFDWSWWPQSQAQGRGVALIRLGLTLYDAYARDPLLPKHQVVRAASAPLPVNRGKFRWMSSYYDAQVAFPERLVMGLLEDARQLALSSGLDFQVFNYHRASLVGDVVEIRPLLAGGPAAIASEVRPAAIVNATGAWVDETLNTLRVPHDRLIGGTKGSHLFTFHPGLRAALCGEGLYAEAGDGRPIFITPLADCVLIGTTDVPFVGQPEAATTTVEETKYLLSAVNEIFPDMGLTSSDVAFHYSAVRPLPYVQAGAPAGITRRHSIVRHPNTVLPFWSLVGGKLTTMRSLAESAAHAVLRELGQTSIEKSQNRVIPGGENYPEDLRALGVQWLRIAGSRGLSVEAIEAAWQLLGTRTDAVLAAAGKPELLPDTKLPAQLARWSIRHEWAQTLADLVERRLMLLYHQRLTTACLRRLAGLLVEEGRLSAAEIDAAVAAQVERLASRYGKQVI